MSRHRKSATGKGLRVGALVLGLWAAAWSGAAQAQSSLADPQGSGVIVAAVRWLEGTLLGTIATVVAVIAVASVGFLMLTGRINWRYGATVILGCFILFGAATHRRRHPVHRQPGTMSRCRASNGTRCSWR